MRYMIKMQLFAHFGWKDQYVTNDVFLVEKTGVRLTK